MIDPVEPGNVHGGFRIRLEARPTPGRYCGCTGAVHFLSAGEFESRFEAFLARREGSAQLEATDENRLEFFRWNAKGDVGLRYSVSTYVFEDDPPEARLIAISGAFKIDGERVEAMAAQLLELLHP